jgi:hypothetical protein
MRRPVADYYLKLPFMDYEPYMDLVALPDLSVFQFISEGPWGRITKQIHFSLLFKPGIYMLQLGDITKYGGFDRSAISNNGDKNRIMATVIQAIEVFTERYPDRSIRIWSLSAERSRLFRIAIGSNFRQLSEKFAIKAMAREGFLLFKKDIDSANFELWCKRSDDNMIGTTLKIQSGLFKRMVSVQLDDGLEKGFCISGEKNLWACVLDYGRESRDSRRIKKPALAGQLG